MPEITPDPKEKTKVLYDAISKKYEVGSYDDFFNKLQDSTKRKTLYDAIGNDYDLGTFDDFSNKVVSKKKVTPPQPSPSSAISSQFREELSKDPNAGLKNLFAQSISEKQQQPPTQRVKDNRFLDFGETEPPKVSEKVKRAERLGAKPYVVTESNLPDIKEAIDNAVEQKNQQYRAKGGTKLPAYVKDQVVEAVKNGDLVPVIENGKSVLKRGAGFFESFFDAVEQHHAQNLEDTYLSTLPKDKAISYLNSKMASPETFEYKRETAPSGVFGKVGEFLGENIPMLTKATAGAVGGTALAPETGGASFGMFLANARDMANSGYAQNLEKNYRGIKEQNPEISDSEAYEKANKAALVGEVTSLATNAVFSYAAPKNIQLPLPSVETTGFTRSLTHAIKSYPKVGVTAAAGSVINDIASNLAGNKVEAEQMGENAVESAKEMAIMHFGLWALGQPFKIPSYLRPQAENIVASAPREEVKQFYKGMEERGVFPEGTADKVVEKLNEFEEQKQVVNGMDLNEEQKASITGKLLQRKKIEEENKELKKYGGSFNARIENNDKAILKLDLEIDGIVKTGNVEKFEKDNLTGQTPTEIGKSVEEQLKPVKEPKVEEEVKATETIVEVKSFKQGDGGTRGVFEDKDGKLYKSIEPQEMVMTDKGVVRQPIKYAVTNEHKILSELQDNPHIPKVGKIVNTTEGKAFEIEKLDEVDNFTKEEYRQVQKILNDLNDKGYHVGDRVTIMKRPKTGELVVVDFSAGYKGDRMSRDAEDYMQNISAKLSKSDAIQIQQEDMAAHNRDMAEGLMKDESTTEYYLTQRPPSIGTHPTEGLKSIEETEYRGKKVWKLTYDNKLSADQIYKFELTPKITNKEFLGQKISGVYGKNLFYVSDIDYKQGKITLVSELNGKEISKDLSFKEFQKGIDDGKYKVEQKPKAEVKAELKPTKTLTNEEKVKQLRAEEQAEYDAIRRDDGMVTPLILEKEREIYNKYDKLITPLLEKDVMPKEISDLYSEAASLRFTLNALKQQMGGKDLVGKAKAEYENTKTKLDNIELKLSDYEQSKSKGKPKSEEVKKEKLEAKQIFETGEEVNYYDDLFDKTDKVKILYKTGDGENGTERYQVQFKNGQEASIWSDKLQSLKETPKAETPKAETKEQPKSEVSLRDVELKMRRPEKNEVIFVPVDALLKKHSTDQPSYDIQKEDNRIKGRVEKAKEFIKNYIKDQRAINPRTGERTNAKVSFEPSVVDIDANGKISFEDGRHRVLAAKEFGLKEVPIEVPKGKGKEIEQYIKEEAKPKQEIVEEVKKEEVSEKTPEQVTQEQLSETETLLSGEAEKRRKEGKFTKDGIEFNRNEKGNGLSSEQGGEVRFTSEPGGGGVVVPFKYKLVEAETLQPSHQNGIRNPLHFIPEAQPKNRNDIGTLQAEESFANNPRFKEMGESTNAYSGAPVVNERNEVVQGNNRSAGLRKGYQRGNQSYKEALSENANKFGFTKEQVQKMKNPILVREVAASDVGAIELGNYDVKDLETGGKRRLDPVAITRRLPFNIKGRLSEIFKGDETLNQSIRSNAKKIIDLLNSYLNQAQRNTLFKEGELTESGAKDLEMVVQHLLFDGGDVALPDLFEQLSHTQKEGLRKSLPYVFSTTPEKSIVPEIQEAIIALNHFNESNTGNISNWLAQPDMFNNSRTPKDIYSPTAIEITKRLAEAKNQKEVSKIFNEYANEVNDKSATLLEEAKPGVSKKEGIKNILKTEYDETKKTTTIEGIGRKDSAEQKAEPKETPISSEPAKERAKSRLTPKPDIATKARDLAEKIRSGEKQILPDWLKADLPKNTKLSGISFEEAAAKALETFADVYEKVKDTAQAISEALVHLRDWHKENNLDFDEKDWTRKFEENLSPKQKEKTPEERKVGISHEALKKLSKKLGLKEPVRGQRATPEEMANRGRLLYNAGADVEQLAKDFKDGMQPTADDISIVRAHIEDLAKIADEMYAKWGNGRQFTEAKQELSKWQVVAKEMGTIASEPFTALQGERDLDSDSFTVVKGSVEQKMEKLGGINARQEKKIIQLTEQNKKLKEEAKKAEKNTIEAANKSFGGKGKGTSEVTFSEKSKKIADSFRKLKVKEFIFRDENGNEIQLHKAGVSWNELVEIGAKAIEKTGEIADGVAAIIENIKDKEWYQKLSDKDKSNLEKQFTQQFEDAVEETPEAKLIRRLQNELENIQKGIVKQSGIKIEDTPEIKELRDEIFEAKKNLGLIKGRTTPEPKTKLSEEQKRINRLERELKDLEQGLVKQKAEQFKDTPKIKELKDKIYEQKQKLGLLPSKGKVSEYAYGLTETPESRNLKRLEKELENLRQGILKEPPNKRELSNAEKELKDKIFEQKQMMGLIPSKNVKDTDYGLEITLEEKKIERLEKEKEDLENGIIKQKNVNNLNPTPEQKEKINKLKEEINGLKENLGLIKSKQEKPLTEEEQIEQKEKRKEEIIDLLDKNVLRDLKNPKNMFSIEEKKAIWKYAKEEYLDKGVDYKDMISLVAEDLGLTWGQMNYAITTPEIKKISDEMWVRQSNYRKNQNATKRWVEEQGKNEYAKLLKRISDKIRGISVFGHGGIFVGTHAMMTLFDPLTWKQTVPAFFRAWKYAYGNKANYEIAMQELKNMGNYSMAQRAGLKNNPDVINAEEFQRSQNFLGKLGGAGEQGFNAIKVLRQDLFDYHWNKLTESEKLDLDDKGVSMAAKEIAWLINNSTGATNLSVPEWLNEATFAGGMEMARWAKLTRNPVRAAEIAVRALVNPKKATSSEKVFARVWASRVGRQLGTMASALAINYALQNAINPKNKVNISNPQENDFGKFKIGDINIDASSGMIGVTNFIKSLFIISSEELEELGGDTRMEATGKKSIQYLRGKLAPFYQKVSDVAFNTDFSGNVLPYSSDKPRQGKHKLGWTEYLWQAAPLPIAEAAHIMYETAAEHGGDPKIVDALVMAAISGGTGAKPSMFKEKQMQFTEEDKKSLPFKFFIDRGAELKNVNPYRIEIEDEQLEIKKPLNEYPKETIDNFKKIHKQNFKENLESVQLKGVVYVDKFGNLTISRNEDKPQEEIELTKLNKEQLQKIISICNSDATDKTKKEVFNQ